MHYPHADNFRVRMMSSVCVHLLHFSYILCLICTISLLALYIDALGFAADNTRKRREGENHDLTWDSNHAPSATRTVVLSQLDYVEGHQIRRLTSRVKHLGR